MQGFSERLFLSFWVYSEVIPR